MALRWAVVVSKAPGLGGTPSAGHRSTAVANASAAASAGALHTAAASAHASERADRLTMVRATTDDGQCLTALNEIYAGQPSHQTARYTPTLPNGRCEAQASSGLIIPTGTGATGCSSSDSAPRGSKRVVRTR
jgi:hypothetical protein